MKKAIPFIVLIICLLLSSCQPDNIIFPQPETQEFRGIWISCYDHIPAAEKTEAEYEAETDRMFRTVAEYNFNAAFVHLRAFSDAFYKSEIYPYSSYIAGAQGADLPFDPFEVMLRSAEKFGISVHGWINPFRISSKTDTSALSDSNPAKRIIDSGNVNGEVCVLSNGIYYNPSCPSSHELVLRGVKEIIEKYDIDGIHIDDYFYPSTDESVDSIQYSDYLKNGGALGIAEWRKANVNAFVSALYATVKSADSNLIFSISPSADSKKNLNELYADCELWLSSDGYADMIIPQIYYGFEHEKLGFHSLVTEWSALPRNPKVSLVCGVAAYKCGTKDKYAGSGSEEWSINSDVLSRQIAEIRNNGNFSGFAVFSYGDLLRKSAENELSFLKENIHTENLV